MRDIEDYSREYRELPFEATQAQFRRRLVLEQINSNCSESVLEIGCGMHPLFTSLKSETEVVVVEPSAEFAMCARQLAASHSNARVIEDFIENIIDPIRLDGFDFIVLSSLLHEVESPENLLRAVLRHCNPQTVIHINVPNAYSLHRLLAVEMGLVSDVFNRSDTQQRMQQSSTFDLVGLARLLIAEGFEVVDSGSYFIKLFTHAQMQQLCDIGFLNDDHLRGFSGLIRHLPQFGSEIYVNARPRYV